VLIDRFSEGLKASRADLSGSGFGFARPHNQKAARWEEAKN
jgi:hypothetical protein